LHADEVRHLGRLAGRVLGAVVRRSEELHIGVADRVFHSIGPAATPVRVVHDRFANAAYRTVGGAFAGAGRLGGELAARKTAFGGASLSDHPKGRAALGILNGAHGDLLEREFPALALQMTLRHDGRDLPVRSEALRRAYPQAGPRVAVFLHGLVETEDAWRFRSQARHGDRLETYGSMLERDLGYTPVWVRYNTGRRISDNGRDLAALLSRLAEAWPVPLAQIVLIGHSMGGLVARSALGQAGEGSAEGSRLWPGLVSDTVTLGTPHLGAPLEQSVNTLAHHLRRVNETRWLATTLAARSVGIKDLRFGNLVEADWIEVPADARASARTHIPLYEGARHFVVLATLAGDADSRLGEFVGDLLVRPRSARGDTGDETRLRYDRDHVLPLTGLHHLDLLNHPKVYRRLHAWLGGDRREDGCSDNREISQS
jgi:pimeloyl-ACP methyl ester carboxylesterase